MPIWRLLFLNDQGYGSKTIERLFVKFSKLGGLGLNLMDHQQIINAAKSKDNEIRRNWL